MNNNNGTGKSMGNPNQLEKYLLTGTKSFKDYILLFRNNIKYILIISLSIIIIAAVYAFLSKNIYTSTASVRITNPYKNVLENGRQNQDESFLDRYIVSEMGIIANFTTRKKVAEALIDSFKTSNSKDLLPLLSEKKGGNSPKPVEQIAGMLGGVISVEQNQGTDIVYISAQSRSPYEAALVANCTAKEYQKINTLISRDKLTSLRKFLEDQAQEKLVELRSIEDSLMKFQEKGGIISFDVQSTNLIGQLSNLDAQKESIKMELLTSNEVLKQYKFFLRKQDPQLVEYLESQTSQAYINALQQQLAELQVNRDIAMSIKSPNVDVSSKVKEYDERIAELKQKLNSTISTIKADAYSGNPDQVRDLAQRLIEEEIRNSSLTVQLQQLESATGKYEGNLRRLPKASTVLSQYQRERESLQQTYLLLNERFQEAMINEASESGNVVILNPAVIPDGPSKPNRLLIILIGFILGPVISFALILIKDHFDDTVKTPDDIEKAEISFLTWIPQYKSERKGDNDDLGSIVLDETDSPLSESFRAIKARIQQSMDDFDSSPRIILVTSPAEGEGKSFVSVNLAASFAQSNKRTLLVDCDLRRPTIHTKMGVDKRPGLVDYLSRKSKSEDIIRKTKTNDLSFITSGSTLSNPAEVFESKAFKSFLQGIKDFFDIIILDSPPIIAVIDAEILAKQVDGTILVISADKTENRLLTDAVGLINRNKANFFGTVLNNFKYKSGYGYYYKYYYNYSKSSGQKGKKSFKLKS
ncbi:MAG TPA: polysaccharide biosynthesis tyrosine autokinase [Ignavibacteriaceae bacterium]|nr:polysaccharide biosynthesis tyrosine autokinase [Ignavibacteriaceae bacterium]